MLQKRAESYEFRELTGLRAPCYLFNEKSEICASAQKEFTQIFPHPGWVEYDANEIWSTQLGVAVEAMQKA